MSSTATSLLAITRSTHADYVVRSSGPCLEDSDAAREELRAVLLGSGAADEAVDIRFVGDIGLEALFDSSASDIVSLGWEGLLVPYPERRRLTLPRGCVVTADASAVDADTLLALRPKSEWILASNNLDLSESMLLHRDGELIGWAPVWRVAPAVSIIQMMCIHPSVHRDEERRRTHLRLALFARAAQHQCDQGRSVIVWLPDDGDPVKDAKVSVGGALATTHWMQVRVRRDLTGPGILM